MNHQHQSGTVAHLFAGLMRVVMFRACISLAFTGFVNYFYLLLATNITDIPTKHFYDPISPESLRHQCNHPENIFKACTGMNV